MTQALDSSVQTAKYSGLFGYAERASIKNLTLRAIRSAPAISGPVSVGGLAGALYIPSLSNVTVSEAVFDFNFGDGGAQNIFAGGVSGELNGGTWKMFKRRISPLTTKTERRTIPAENTATCPMPPRPCPLPMRR